MAIASSRACAPPTDAAAFLLRTPSPPSAAPDALLASLLTIRRPARYTEPRAGRRPQEGDLARGLRRRLTSYGDQDFSLFLRKAFIKAMGFSDDALDRPIVGIANTYSDYNPCHGNVPAADRGGEARRHARRRAADGLPDDVDPRELRRADLDVPAQPDGDGDRGDDPRPADGRGRADRRLRQDAAGADHGGGLQRGAGDRAADRPDGDRQPPRRAARRLHRLPPALGPLPRRRDRRRRDRPRSTTGWSARSAPAR